MTDRKVTKDLYLVVSVTTDDIKRDGKVIKDIKIVELQSDNGSIHNMFISKKQEQAKGCLNYDACVGKVVRIGTEHQIAGETGYMDADKEILDEVTASYPRPFGRVAVETEVGIYADDLGENKKVDRGIAANSKQITAWQELGADKLSFLEKNAFLAAALK